MTSLLLRLFAVLAVLALATGCGGGGDEASGDGSTGPQIPESPVITGDPAGYNAADITFASTMVKHHQQGIELAKLVSARSGNQQLTALADQIVAIQQPEINILNVFLVQWDENPDIRTGPGGDEPRDQSVPGTVDDATVARLESLQGPQFDTLWLETMLGHHQGGVDIATREIDNGANVDAVSVAKSIVAGLNPQMSVMRQMLEGMP